MKLCPVILAGGSGSRLWPLSREQYAKQLLTLTGDESLLQLTAKRLEINSESIEITEPLVICNEEYRFQVADQLDAINVYTSSIMLEPEGRNTAPAITLASRYASDKWDDPLILIMPADHLIPDSNTFSETVFEGCKLAADDHVVTFGIVPNKPETGYGYIQLGKELGNTEKAANELNQFIEKPNKKKAEKMLTEGGFLWNSGIFLFKASLWLSLIEKFSPDIFSCANASYETGSQDTDFFWIGKEAFLQCPNDSIDYAVMEHLGEKEKDIKSTVLSLDVGWSDIGSWNSVWELEGADENGNRTKGDVLIEDTRNSLIISEHRLTAVLGCDDVVVIETADAVLVTKKSCAQDVRKIVKLLKESDREEYISHRRVYRPWGSYECIDEGKNFQVKRLIVTPGKKLSLQLHHQRAEHWVIVNGIATVTRNNEAFELKQNESTYIPLGVKHRLENKEKIPLEVIEVQSGDYLGEDDIVRFDDDFGRHTEDK